MTFSPTFHPVARSFFYPGKLLDETGLSQESAAIANVPLKHLSPSAIKCYLENRQQFFRRYVRMEFDTRGGAAMLEGNAFHKVFELYGKDLIDKKEPDFDRYLETAIAGMIAEDAAGKVDWGKEGSLDNSIAVLKRAVEFYRAEMKPFTPIDVERKSVASFQDEEGNMMPLPLKTFSDRIDAEGDEIDIIDYKLVSSFPDLTEPQPEYEIQAAANFFTVRASMKQVPRRMVYILVKKSKNDCPLKVDEIKELLKGRGIAFDAKSKKPELVEVMISNGLFEREPQVREYVINFFDTNGEAHLCLKRFVELYRRILCELCGFPLVDAETGVMRFLPNPAATFGWKESWADFCDEVDNGTQWDRERIIKAQENAFSDEGVEAADL